MESGFQKELQVKVRGRGVQLSIIHTFLEAKRFFLCAHPSEDAPTVLLSYRPKKKKLEEKGLQNVNSSCILSRAVFHRAPLETTCSRLARLMHRAGSRSQSVDS
ncbi:hypothetical protein CDAR_8711 [Caerostris darwini]|uniref:Uncharacterized protein n=1 Tax=Caerostris darwini TaxID=1538125 RepID=A0AAV4R588_9ARAC|nr:hypothetical protein CDAR_8711 [Caerostris darwini]